MLRTLLLVLLSFLLVPGLAVAQAAPSRENLERFFDKAWASTKGRRYIPGGVVAVVSRDGPIFIKGYGVTDIRSREPVDPSATLFRIGSTSKLFTAILALQLVEQGKLKLDDDIRSIIPPLPGDQYRDPVTVRQLLSHTAGFDNDISGIMVPSNAEGRFRADVHARHLVRMRKPGIVVSYDNSGVALLGRLAAGMNGSDYATAVARHVFRPLGMRHSTVGPSDARIADLAACHRIDAVGTVRTCPFSIMRQGFEGAGGIASTGADMARFLTMLLNGGSFDGGRLLSERSFRALIDADTNRFHPALPELGLIMREEVIGQNRVLGHAGGYDGFSSDLIIFPHDGLAVFMSFETYPGLPAPMNLSYVMDRFKRQSVLQEADGYAFLRAIAGQFARRFATPDAPKAVELKTLPDLKPPAVAGLYRAASDSASLIDKLLAAFSTTRVEALDPDTIAIDGVRYSYIDGSLYGAGPSGKVAFRETGSGTAMAYESTTQYIRTPWCSGPVSAGLFLAAIFLTVPFGGFLAVRLWMHGDRRHGVLLLCGSVTPLIVLCLEMQYFPVLYYEGFALWFVALWRSIYVGGIAMIAFLLVRQISEMGKVSKLASVLDRSLVFAMAIIILLLIATSLVWGLQLHYR